MGMTIECTSCHAKFAGKDEFLGRRMRCPKCQNIFRVPPAAEGAAVPQASPKPTENVVLARLAPSDAPAPSVVNAALIGGPAAASPTPAAPAKPKNKYANVEVDEWNPPEDFEYSVTEEPDPAAQRCPFCHNAMRPEDILCMSCGYNRKLGQKMGTKKTAEVEAEEAEKARATGVSFGSISLSYKSIIIGGGAMAAVALLLFLILPGLLMLMFGFGGMVLMFIGSVGVVYVAFQEDSTQGMLVIFMPIYWWVYVFSRWDQAAIPFIIWLIGFVLTLLAGGILASMGEETAALTPAFFAAADALRGRVAL